MKIFILILCLLSMVFADITITNVQARQEGLEIIITYNMAGDLKGKGEIMVGVSTDGGRNYKPINDADGDLGKNMKTGSDKEITWLINNAIVGKNTKFKVGTITDFPLSGMIYVEGGTFRMGSTNGVSSEEPVHTVTVNGFFMDIVEVTQAEYRRVMGRNPSFFSDCDDCPVENISWHDASAYSKKVSKRLPTEAEWEYAARGGNKSKGYTYSGSNDIGSVTWYKRNSSKKTYPVAQKQPNELGLYDMTGNVWEWCSDWYGNYSSSPQTDPKGSNLRSSRVLRGGSYLSGAFDNRVSSRRPLDPDYKSRYYGFRLVLEAD